jgi:type IV conjugative transfer system protein TraE
VAKKFLNEFREALKEARILKLFVLILVALVIFEFILVGKLVFNQKIVLVPERLHKKVYIEGDNASVDYVQAFAYAVLSNYYNYIPENVEKNYKYFVSYFDPSIYSSVGMKILGLADRYKKMNASSFATIKSMKVYPDRRIVEVEAVVRTFVGDAQTSLYVSNVTMGYSIDDYSFKITSFDEKTTNKFVEGENGQEK